MKEFSCGDVIPGCKAQFSFATTEELLEAVSSHAREDHGIVELSPAVLQNVMDHIHTVAA